MGSSGIVCTGLVDGDPKMAGLIRSSKDSKEGASSKVGNVALDFGIFPRYRDA